MVYLRAEGIALNARSNQVCLSSNADNKHLLQLQKIASLIELLNSIYFSPSVYTNRLFTGGAGSRNNRLNGENQIYAIVSSLGRQKQKGVYT